MYTKRQTRFMDSSIKAEFADGEQHSVDEDVKNRIQSGLDKGRIQR